MSGAVATGHTPCDVSRALAPLHQLINVAGHLNFPSELALADALDGHSAADMTVRQLLDLIEGLH